MDVPALASSALNFANQIFNTPSPTSSSEECLVVKDLKVFFTVLSGGRLRDKFSYLFRQFADAGKGNFMSRQGLAMMLATISKVSLAFTWRVSGGFLHSLYLVSLPPSLERRSALVRVSSTVRWSSASPGSPRPTTFAWPPSVKTPLPIGSCWSPRSWSGCQRTFD